MRIVLCHNNFKVTGGAEVFFHQVGRVLEENGHEVAYLVSNEVGDGNLWAAYSPRSFDYRNLGVKSIFELPRLFYSYEAKRCTRRLCRDFKPDLIHAFAVSTKLTPSVLDSFSDMGIPIVASMNDYKHICPNSKLFHHGRVCEDCRGGRYYKAIINNCCHYSMLWSAASALESYVHSAIDSYKKNVSTFLFASQYMAKATERFWGAGSFAWKILRNPFNSPDFVASKVSGDYCLFFGRLVEEKGVGLLLDAMSMIPHVRLKIVGDGPLSDELQVTAVKQGLENVQFLGPRWGGELEVIIRDAKFIVVPSLWHENYPYVIVQAFALAKPVIGSDRGGIPELIGNNERGIVYPANSKEELSNAMNALWSDEELRLDLGNKAKEYADREFCFPRFYRELMNIYSENKNKSR